MNRFAVLGLSPVTDTMKDDRQEEKYLEKGNDHEEVKTASLEVDIVA